MILSETEVLSVASDMIGSLDKALMKDGRLGKLRRYLKGQHDLPYMPRGAKREYRALAEKAITNWLPLVADTYSKALSVVGYRSATAADNDAAWLHWQANGLDARQSIAHRAALEYGVGYVLVLPSDDSNLSPSIRPLHPTRVWAEYEDEDDDFPAVAIVWKGTTPGPDKARIFHLYDDQRVYTVLRQDSDAPRLDGDPAEHGFDHIPLVRFRDRLDGDNDGIIRPLLTIQDRINEAVFSLLIAIQYASFRQRWATGLAIPETDELDANGQPTGKKVPVEPFKAAVDRLWVTDNPDARFGDFSQTDTRGHLEAYQSAVRTLAAIAQTPPHVLLGDLINLSADALAAAEASTQRKAEEYATIFGESWELVLKLAVTAAGGSEPSEDAQVRWRDTEARSFAQTVDGLGKMVQMLSVPAEGAWERIPGVTDADIKRWKEMGATPDGMRMLADALTRQTAPAAPAAPATAPVAAPPAPDAPAAPPAAA